MSISFILDTYVQLLSGLPLTLNLAFFSIANGAILGVFLALLRLSPYRSLSWVSESYLFVFRGTPLLVQIFLIYYGLGQFRPTLQELGLWTFFRSPYWCAILALSLNSAAYASEIIRGGILSVPSQQIEAGRACGMSRLLLARRIVLPIALRNALPAYTNECILIVKATSLASIITLMEVTGIAAKLIAETFRTVEIFLVAGSMYLAINFILTRFFMLIEARLSRHLRDPVEARVPSHAA